MSEWFGMGHYGRYIWSAYGITALVFIINLASSLLENKRIKATVKNYLTSQIQ